MRQTHQTTASATRCSGDCIAAAEEPNVLYVAFELGWGQWKLASGTGPAQKPRRRTIPARDLAALGEELIRAKRRLGLPEDAPVASCYEAGRDGFWLHRYLTAQGLENVVVDSSSIEVNRRSRRAKSDKLDAGKLLSMLMRYHRGEAHVWSVCAVPRVGDEDLRQRQRELETLRQERTNHVNRIKGLLANHGLDERVDAGLGERLQELELWDGSPLPGYLRGRIERELERIEVVDGQIGAIERERREHERRADDERAAQVRHLCTLRGIGPESAWLTVGELFGWRDIRNRKELAALAGLTPTPYDSGDMRQDQGISKAGNKRVRWMMIQIAWSWLRNQPNSELSRWFERRFGAGGKRQKRIGIVALARKLLVKLWQYLTTGALPEGAVLQT
jgi:transposase